MEHIPIAESKSRERESSSASRASLRGNSALKDFESKSLCADNGGFAPQRFAPPAIPPLALPIRHSLPELMRSPASGLTVNQPGDPFEQEADRVADQVMRMASPPVTVQRKCSSCAQEEQLQRKCANCEEEENKKLQRKCDKCEEEEKDKLQRKEAGAGPPAAPPIVHEVLSSPGQPLDAATRAFMEPRFGHDFRHVRIHADERAAQSAKAVDARAYTVGPHVVFDGQEYAPHTERGRHLLAHELAHVDQQNLTEETSSVHPLLQRTTHGSSTPTNCHNWALPLPPWIAGTVAHGQISSFLRVLPHRIPRASKIFKGLPSFSLIPWGFADLWQNMGASINVAEIKSTATGSTVAADEALHYQRRHDEWLGREVGGTADASDAAYFPEVGGLLPAAPLDLSSITGTDLIIGNFVADPPKLLHIEADRTGAMVYWCTGPGIPVSPIWIPIAKAALDKLKKMLEDAKRKLGEVVTEVAAAMAALGKVLTKVLLVLLVALVIIAILAMLIIAIACALGATVTLGATTICSAAAVGSAVVLAAGLLLLIGISIDKAPAATANLVRAMRPDIAAAESESGADYEKESDRMFSQVSSPAQAAPLVAAYNPLAEFLDAIGPVTTALQDPVAAVRSFAGNLDNIPSDAIQKLNDAVASLDQSGDASTAGFIRSTIQSSGLDKVKLTQADPADDAQAVAILDKAMLGGGGGATTAVAQAGEETPAASTQATA